MVRTIHANAIIGEATEAAASPLAAWPIEGATNNALFGVVVFVLLAFSFLLGWRIRRRADESRFPSLLRAQQMALDAAGIVAVTDGRGTITHVNDNFCRISKYARSELLGQNHRILNSGVHPKAFFRDMYATIARGKPWRAEICNRAKDGSLYWVDTTIVPVMGADRRPAEYIALRIDVTHRKLAESKAQERDQFTEGVLQNINAAIAVLDESGKFVSVNDRWRRTISVGERGSGRGPQNYLDACDRAAQTGRREAETIAEGVRAVIAGQTERFEHEYQSTVSSDCHWFLVRVTSFQEHHQRRILVTHEDTTRLRRAEREAADARGRLERAASLARVGAWELDVETDEITWSDEVCRIHSAPPDTRPTTTEALAYYADEDRGTISEAMHRVVETGEPFDLETQINGRDGKRRWVRVMGEPVYESGRLERVAGAFQDITESHLAKEQLRLAIDAADAGVWDWHIPSDTVRTNVQYHQMLGRPDAPSPSPLAHYLEYIHPDDRAQKTAALDRAQNHGDRHYMAEFRMRCEDGRYKWIRSVGKVIERDSEGRAVRIIGQHFDIDAERRSRHKLEALERRLRLFVEHTPAAVAMFDRDMRYMVASWGWQEQYGLGETDLIGRSHYEVFPTVPERWKDIHRRCLEGASLASEQDHFTLGDGSKVWVRWNIRPWHTASGEIGGIIMLTEVINSQIEQMQRLEAARAEAEAANRAKSEFLANMSHEIRTPMTAIMGFADVLEEDGDISMAPEQRIQAIHTIQRNGAHLLAIINDILDVSKIEAGKLTIDLAPVDPVGVVTDIISLMNVRAAGKGITLQARYDTPVPKTILTDATRLRQILTNLVGNAIKFTEIGSVTVAVSVEENQGAHALILSVIDTGVGLSPEQVAGVQRFEAFNQVDTSMTRRFGGAGLGLRISNSLARMLGGGITVISTLGQGSAFSVSIDPGDLTGVEFVRPDQPVETPEETQPAEEQKADAQPAATLEGVRILLAEDGPDNQRLISYFVRKSGALVTIANNGAAAIEAIEDQDANEPFDLVLMDMQMPILDGYSATERLRAAGCSLPIIALTAHAMSSDRERCLKAGCDDYISKPVDRSTLVELCAQWVQRESNRHAA